jgi:6-phosphogluconolactonase
MALFLYLSLLKEEKIAWYRVDPQSGELALQGKVPVPGEPSVQGVDPSRRFLYAAIRSTGQLCSFRIDPQSGQLEHLHTINTGLEDPAYMATDHTGRYLVTPYYASGKVTVYAIGNDGAAREPLLSSLHTAPHAHGFAIDQSNRYAFVPHTCPGNSVWQLTFADGILQSNTPPRVEFDREVGPRHLHIHPENGCAYSDNEQDNSVTAYRFDPASGTLTPFQTLSTVPDDYQGGACARMELHPSGRFLYATNRGHDSLAGFRIDPQSGALESIGQFPTEENPRSFHFDPQGRFLYAAGESNDRLRAYRVDDQSGALDPLHTYETGHVPWWVQVVEPG